MFRDRIGDDESGQHSDFKRRAYATVDGVSVGQDGKSAKPYGPQWSVAREVDSVCAQMRALSDGTDVALCGGTWYWDSTGRSD